MNRIMIQQIMNYRRLVNLTAIAAAATNQPEFVHAHPYEIPE